MFFFVDSKDNCMKHDRVRHYKRVVRSFADLDDVIKDIPGNFDLIWDLRGDYTDDLAYDTMVHNEIAMFNEIMLLLPPTCLRVSVKIRTRNIKEYVLPVDGRFFYLPELYCRMKTELRFVGLRNNTCAKLSDDIYV